MHGVDWQRGLRRWGGLLGGFAVVLLATAAIRAGEQGDGEKKQEDRPAGAKAAVDVQVDTRVVAEIPDRWIGLGCREEVPEALRVQLALEEGQGLLVDLVADGSPAEKAGFKKYDVVVTADGKPVGSIEDLMRAVKEAGDKKMSVEVLRGGQRKTIEVTPAERPEGAWPRQPFQLKSPREAFEQWLEAPFGEDEAGRRFRFRFYGPGAILPPRVHIETPLPGNVSVTITKKGNEPAKIVVKQDGKTWEVTEENLDELPENVRRHVQRMLGRAWEIEPGRVRIWDWVPDWVPPRPRTEIRPRILPRSDLEKRLEETNRRLEELEKRLEGGGKESAEPETEEGAKKRV